MIETNLNLTTKIKLLPISSSLYTSPDSFSIVIENISKLSFNFHYAQSLFISSIHCLKQSVYSKLFIRNSVDNKTLLHDKIIYHAIKYNYVLDHKCVFNRLGNIYELKSINSHTKRID